MIYDNDIGLRSNTTDKRKHDFNVFEGVTVCINHADFLDETLKYNLGHFDRFVVITDFNDRATQKVCSKYSVECVSTDVHRERDQTFNKGQAINLGFAYLRRDGWVVHLDADIVLPDRFRNVLYKTHLDPYAIYGANRFNVVGWDKWVKYKNSASPQYHDRFMVDTPADFPIGATLIHKEYGYCPIGYFQMFSGLLGHRYPSTQSSAEHSDVVFALKWPRSKRFLLPSVRVLHLESEAVPMGTNWNGRKTKRFGPV